MRTMKTYCFIFARAGSKELPNKNIRLLAGKPLLSYSIHLAKTLPFIDKIFVSTDSPEAMDIAKKNNVIVIPRPDELATDYANEFDAWKHAISWVIDNIGHFGLSLRNYAHFTSPIRRYSDLLVHRALIDAASAKKPPGDGQNGLPTEQIAEICIHISETEASAAAAERRTIDRFAAALFTKRLRDVVEGVIIGITGFGAFVRLEDGAADGFLPLAGLPDDFYDLDAAGRCLTGRHSGWSFSVGTNLKAKVEEVTPISGGILLSWMEGGTITEKKKRKASSSRRQTKEAKAGVHFKSKGAKRKGAQKKR